MQGTADHVYFTLGQHDSTVATHPTGLPPLLRAFDPSTLLAISSAPAPPTLTLLPVSQKGAASQNVVAVEPNASSATGLAIAPGSRPCSPATDLPALTAVTDSEGLPEGVPLDLRPPGPLKCAPLLHFLQ